jgi:hypothetical protein
MAKGKYYTPKFKEQAVKMVVGLDCTDCRCITLRSAGCLIIFSWVVNGLQVPLTAARRAVVRDGSCRLDPVAREAPNPTPCARPVGRTVVANPGAWHQDGAGEPR